MTILIKSILFYPKIGIDSKIILKQIIILAEFILRKITIEYLANIFFILKGYYLATMKILSGGFKKLITLFCY